MSNLFPALSAEIEELNSAAREIQQTKALSPTDALCHLINIMGLEEIAADQDTALYRLANGRVVNCWHEAPIEELCEGGLGFDGYLDWHTQRDGAGYEPEETP